MIVKEGRKLIALNGINNIKNKLYFFIEKSSSEVIDTEYMTTPESELSENITDIAIGTGSLPSSITESVAKYHIDETAQTLTVTAVIVGKNERSNDELDSNLGTYAAAGLYYKDGATKTLISRVTFKETTITDPGSKYKLEYTIYF